MYTLIIHWQYSNTCNYLITIVPRYMPGNNYIKPYLEDTHCHLGVDATVGFLWIPYMPMKLYTVHNNPLFGSIKKTFNKRKGM